MRIDATSALLQSLLAAPAKRAEPQQFGGDAFAAKPAARPTVANPVQSVQMLVALAATANEPERRRLLAEQADQGLTELEKLHKELVAGVASISRLRSLRDWVRRRMQSEDAELARLMDDIELRILVELAKADRS